MLEFKCEKGVGTLIFDKIVGFDIKALPETISKVRVRDKELTIVTHPAMERVGRACWLGEVMAHISNGGWKPIAPRPWPWRHGDTSQHTYTLCAI